MITLFVQNGYQAETLKQSTFPAGEEYIAMSRRMRRLLGKNDEVTIKAYLRSSGDVMALLQISDYIDEVNPDIKKVLNMNYIPYARQDRECSVGEPTAIKTIARLLNSCKFSSVTVVDPHSEVSVALLDRLTVISQHTISGELLHQYDTVVVPDLGALKKAKEFGKPLLVLDKTRADDGTISVEVLKKPEHLGKCIVVDDICDGGGTFLAVYDAIKELEGLESVDLRVTHGIFSNGAKEKLLEVFNNVTAYEEWD